MVAAAGGAPAVRMRRGPLVPARSSAGAHAIPMRTVGAAHSIVTFSRAMLAKTEAGSTLRRQTWVAPAAVTIQTNVHPLAWNMGSVQRYRSPQPIG